MNVANHTRAPSPHATAIVTRLVEFVDAARLMESTLPKSKAHSVSVPVPRGSAGNIVKILNQFQNAEFLGGKSGMLAFDKISDNGEEFITIRSRFDAPLVELGQTHEGDISDLWGGEIELDAPMVEGIDALQTMRDVFESYNAQGQTEALKNIIPDSTMRVLSNKLLVDYSRMPVQSRYVFDSIMKDISAAIKPMKSPTEKLGDDTIGHVAEVVDESASKEQSVRIPMPDKETASAVKWLLEECRNTLGSTTFKESFSVDNKANYVTLRAKGTKSLSDVLEVFDDIEERTLTQGLKAIGEGDMQKHFAKTVYNMPDSAANVGGGISAA